MVQVQKQEGGKDCGLFSIVVTTALAFRLDPAAIAFNQAAMRQHLEQSFEKQTFMPFPTM